MNNISYAEYDQLDHENTILLENFLKENNFELNTLFLSPSWIYKTINQYDVAFRLIFFFQDDNVIGVHLRFNEFRGHIRISNYNFVIRSFITPILKKFFSYTIWKYPLLLKNNLTNDALEYVNDCFELIIKNIEHVTLSPINDKRINKFNHKYVSKWATYILDLRSKEYSDVLSSYSKSLKKSIRKYRNNKDINCEKLNFCNKEEVDFFINWVKIAQKTTGKKIKHDTKALVKFRNELVENGFVYEIFIAKLKNKDILGSLVIYGDDNFVNEAEANASIVAKEMKVMVHDLLRDDVVMHCLDCGIGFYDLSGFNPKESISNKEQGIRFGKSKFRGNEVQYPILNW